MHVYTSRVGRENYMRCRSRCCRRRELHAQSVRVLSPGLFSTCIHNDVIYGMTVAPQAPFMMHKVLRNQQPIGQNTVNLPFPINFCKLLFRFDGGFEGGPSVPFSLLYLSSACVWFRTAKASAIGGIRSHRPFFLFPSHRVSACVPPSRTRQSSDLPACTTHFCTTRCGKRVFISTYFPSSSSHTCLFRRSSVLTLFIF